MNSLLRIAYHVRRALLVERSLLVTRCNTPNYGAVAQNASIPPVTPSPQLLWSEQTFLPSKTYALYQAYAVCLAMVEGGREVG